MDVRQGISTEYNRDSFSITLEEVDLQRLCAQFDLKRDELTAEQAMLLLVTEGERYVLVQAPKYGRPVDDLPGRPGTGVRSQLRANRECMATILTTITALKLEVTRKMVGLEDG